LPELHNRLADAGAGATPSGSPIAREAERAAGDDKKVSDTPAAASPDASDSGSSAADNRAAEPSSANTIPPLSGASGSISERGGGAGPAAPTANAGTAAMSTASAGASGGGSSGRAGTRCDIDNGGCSSLAFCIDTANGGGAECHCYGGSTGDGIGENGCTDVNECLVNNGGCTTKPMATCTNFVGSPRTCQCPSGPTGGAIGPHGCVYQLDDATATDTSTGHVWQRVVESGTFNLIAARDYCQKLSLAGGGWRLPQMTELKTIYDTNYWPHIDPIAFPNTPDQPFWTADNQPQELGFYNTSIGSPSSDEMLRARCVR
jgi:hypothetical protein